MQSVYTSFHQYIFVAMATTEPTTMATEEPCCKDLLAAGYGSRDSNLHLGTPYKKWIDLFRVLKGGIFVA